VVDEGKPVEISNASMDTELIGGEVARIEDELIRLTRQAGVGSQVDETLLALAALPARIRPYYTRLTEALERRDLTYGNMARLEEARKRVLWLYRRSRLEQIFFSKLRLERALRDTLYRQILEAYDEFSSMEQMEDHLRGISDDLLAAELLQEESRESSPPE
jgi:hypothetical protein